MTPSAGPALARALEEAARRDGPLGVEADVLQAAVRARLQARLAARGRPAGDAALEALLARSAGADLVLVEALHAGSAAARAALDGRVRRELEALARKRGVVAGLLARRADEALRAVQAPDARGTTPLQAYDGTCTLLAFLALPMEGRIQEDAGQPGPGEPAPQVRAASPPASPQHPAPSLLGGLCEGRLLEEERRAVQAHRDACARCDGLLRGLAYAGLKPAGTPLPPLPGRAAPGRAGPGGRPGDEEPDPLRDPPVAPTPPARKAAALLLALGVLGVMLGLAFAWRGAPLEERVRRHHDSEPRVVELAARLRQEDPALFEGLVPYTRDELAGAASLPPPEALTPRLLHPVDETLDATPELAWQPAAGVRRHLLTLRSAGGEVLWRGASLGARMDWPEGVGALEPGRVVSWTLEPLEPAGPASAASFRLAPAAAVDAWAQQVLRVREALPPEAPQDLLLATLALRQRRPAEAWRLLRAARARDGADPYAAALARHLTQAHGYP